LKISAVGECAFAHRVGGGTRENVFFEKLVRTLDAAASRGSDRMIDRLGLSRVIPLKDLLAAPALIYM